MEKRIFYVLSLFLFACMQIVNAQKVDEVNWAKFATSVTNVVTKSESKPTLVLLYNATQKKFLSNGGDYSMQGVFSNIGNRFYIMEGAEGAYVIHSNTKNLAEKNLGNCMSIHLGEEDKNTGYPFSITDGTAIFMDRGAEFDSKKSSNSMPNWRFTPVKAGGVEAEGVEAGGVEAVGYYISNIDVVGNANGEVTVKNIGNEYEVSLVVDETKGSQEVYLYSDDAGKLKYSSVADKKDEWYIITEDDYRKTIINLLPYSYVDVSGLVHDGGFNRFNTFAKDWVALKEDGTPVGIEEAGNLGYYLGNYPNKNYVDNFAYDTYSEMLDEDITRKNVEELLAYRSHIIGAGRLERKLYQRYHTWDEYISGYDTKGEMEYKDTPRKKIPVYTFLGADGKYNLVVENGVLTAEPTSESTSSQTQVYVSGANNSLKKSGLEDNDKWDDPVALQQVSDGMYRMILKTGVNLNARNINFKFFKKKPDANNKDWGDFTNNSNEGIDNKIIRKGLANELLDFAVDGNFKLKDGSFFEDNTTYVFTVTDIDKENNKYTLDIQKQKVDGQLRVDNTTELKKDFVYTISKSDGVKADPDFFLDNGDGTYRFMAVDGTYTIKEENKYLKAEVTKDNDVYVSGSNLKYGDWGRPYSISKVSDTSYRLTMTTGKDFSATEMNMKFYYSSDWGGYEPTKITFSGLADGLLKMRTDNDNKNNLAYADGKSLKDNTTYVFTVTPNIDGGYNLDIQEQLEKNSVSSTGAKLVKGNNYNEKISEELDEYTKVDPEFFELKELDEIYDKTWKDWNNKEPWLFWKDYGKYFSAGIYSNGSYKQTVKDAPEGTYYVRCTAVNTGTNVDYGTFTVGGQTVSILPLQEEHKKRYEEIKAEVIKDAKAHLWLTDDYYYQRLDAIVAAKFLEEFKDQYTLEITVKVPKDKGTIDIEFANRNTDAASALANPVFADNFQIFYGKQEYVAYISANNANLEKLDTYAYNKLVDLYVRRAFQKGAWNSIVLPFDIKVGNVVDAFGEGAKLSMLKGVNPERPTQIKFDYVSVLPAGECGLVWVPENANEPLQSAKLNVLKNPIKSNFTNKQITESIEPNKSFNGPLYNFGSVSRLDPEYGNEETETGEVNLTPVVTKIYSTGTNNKYNLYFEGYYLKPKKGDDNVAWPKNSYIVDGGNMYYLTEDKGWGVKYATMWYLQDLDSTDAKTFEINGVTDYTVTEISGIAMDTNKVNDGKIYNINGQYVGATADNLPKGLYIVNGKKFVVK